MRYLLSIIFCLLASCAWAFPPGFIGAVTQGASSGGNLSWVSKFNDSFTDTENTLLSTHNSAWVNDSTNVARINANDQLKAADNNFRAHINTSGITTNQKAAARSYSSVANFLVCINYTSLSSAVQDFNGYCVYRSGGNIIINRRTGTSWGTATTTAGPTFSSGEIVSIENINGEITARINGVAYGARSDTTHTGGSPAIGGSVVDPLTDDFEAFNYE